MKNLNKSEFAHTSQVRFFKTKLRQKKKSILESRSLYAPTNGLPQDRGGWGGGQPMGIRLRKTNFVRSVVPRGANLTHYGDPRVGKLTFETLKMSNFPSVARPPSHPSWGKPLISALIKKSVQLNEA